MTLYGIDVSHHNGRVDWPAAHAEGITFMIAKASQGRGFTDPRFRANIAAARAAGLQTGAYHFLTRAPSREQVDNFLTQVAVAGGPAGMLLALDVEDPGTEPEPRFNDVKAFVAEFRRRLPHHPLILYTGRWYWDGRLPDPPAADLGCPLWLSRYVTGSGAPTGLYTKVPVTWWRPGFGGWDRVTILQYSSSGHVAGRGAVDVNAFRGSLDQLRDLTGVPAPAPHTESSQEDTMPNPADLWSYHITDPHKRHPDWSAASLLSSAYIEARTADTVAKQALAEVAALKATVAAIAAALTDLDADEGATGLTVEQITAAAEEGARAALAQATVDVDVTVHDQTTDTPDAPPASPQEG